MVSKTLTSAKVLVDAVEENLKAGRVGADFSEAVWSRVWPRRWVTPPHPHARARFKTRLITPYIYCRKYGDLEGPGTIAAAPIVG
jgi:hypothetical protein